MPDARSRVVVVGAGAVAQVYAHHLSSSCDVAFFVRPARASETARGTTLRRVSLFGRRGAARFVPVSVVTTEAEVAALDPDELWLATDSRALDGEWLPSLLASAPRATVVCLPPGEAALRRVRSLVAEERVVRGAIGMISWKSPLEGSTDRRETGDGYAYVLATSRFSGARAPGVVERLRRGKCPSRLDPKTDLELESGSAFLVPLVAVLEVAGWSLRSLAKSPLLSLMRAAAMEMLAAVVRSHGARMPILPRLVPTLAIRLGLFVLPWVAPFDVETYLRVHFTKVGAQTRDLLLQASRSAASARLPHASIDSLRARLPH